MNGPEFTYNVLVAGGRGDKIWDAEHQVRAESIRAALDKVEEQIAHQDCVVVSIELID